MKGLIRVAAVASAATSAAYTIVYLYRWEWHRAIVAALFLVVAEVALATAAILRRLTALEGRLDAVTAGTPGMTGSAGAADRAGPADPVLHRLREEAPPRRAVFAWLAPDRAGVFLPILLGAGVLASGVAWIIEAVARATAGPVLERRLAARLTALSLPAGGLLGPAPAPAAVRAPAVPPVVRRAALAVLATVAVAWGIDELADATQTRPHQARTGVSTMVELELRGALAHAAPDRVATSLWHSCAGTLRSDMPAPQVTPLSATRFRLDVPVDLGESASRKVQGCLEDAVLDRIQAAVVSLRAVPY